MDFWWFLHVFVLIFFGYFFSFLSKPRNTRLNISVPAKTLQKGVPKWVQKWSKNGQKMAIFGPFLAIFGHFWSFSVTTTWPKMAQLPKNDQKMVIFWWFFGYFCHFWSLFFTFGETRSVRSRFCQNLGFLAISLSERVFGGPQNGPIFGPLFGGVWAGTVIFKRGSNPFLGRGRKKGSKKGSQKWPIFGVPNRVGVETPGGSDPIGMGVGTPKWPKMTHFWDPTWGKMAQKRQKGPKIGQKWVLFGRPCFLMVFN